MFHLLNEFYKFTTDELLVDSAIAIFPWYIQLNLELMQCLSSKRHINAYDFQSLSSSPTLPLPLLWR